MRAPVEPVVQGTRRAGGTDMASVRKRTWESPKGSGHWKQGSCFCSRLLHGVHCLSRQGHLKAVPTCKEGE